MKAISAPKSAVERLAPPQRFDVRGKLNMPYGKERELSLDPLEELSGFLNRALELEPSIFRACSLPSLRLKYLFSLGRLCHQNELWLNRDKIAEWGFAKVARR